MVKLSKGDKTKIKIAEAATKLFLDLGFYEVTFQKIAAGAGLTQPAIYKHFANMDEVVLFSCRLWIEKAQKSIDSQEQKAESGTGKLKSFIDENIRYSSENRSEDGLLLILFLYSMRSPAMLETYRAIKENGIRRIEAIVKLGNKDQSWAVKKTKEASVVIHSLLLGEITKLLVEPEEESVKTRQQRVWNSVRKIL